MDISNNFCVRPVGQGLFYTGRLPTVFSQCRFFNFVYDCGSTRKKGIEHCRFVNHMLHKREKAKELREEISSRGDASRSCYTPCFVVQATS